MGWSVVAYCIDGMDGERAGQGPLTGWAVDYANSRKLRDSPQSGTSGDLHLKVDRRCSIFFTSPPSPASAMRAACRRLAEAATEAGARRGDPYSWRNGWEPSSAATGLLAGRSIAIKENISFRRAPTTCSSQILDGQSIHYTMHVIAAEDVIE